MMKLLPLSALCGLLALCPSLIPAFQFQGFRALPRARATHHQQQQQQEKQSCLRSSSLGVDLEGDELEHAAQFWLAKSKEARATAVERVRREMSLQMDQLKERLGLELEAERRKVGELANLNQSFRDSFEQHVKSTEQDRHDLLVIAKAAVEQRATDVRQQLLAEYRVKRTQLLERAQAEHEKELSELRHYIQSYMVSSQERQLCISTEARKNMADANATAELAKREAVMLQERVTSLESQSALSTQCFSQLFDLRHQLEASKAELLEQRKAYSAYMISSHEQRLACISELTDAKLAAQRETGALRKLMSQYLVASHEDRAATVSELQATNRDAQEQIDELRAAMAHHLISSHEDRLSISRLLAEEKQKLAATQRELDLLRQFTQDYMVKSHLREMELRAEARELIKSVSVSLKELQQLSQLVMVSAHKHRVQSLSELRAGMQSELTNLRNDLEEQRRLTSTYMISSHRQRLEMLSRLQREAQIKLLESKRVVSVAGVVPSLPEVKISAWPAHGRDCGA